MSFSEQTAEMMGVDFVARCLASRAHAHSSSHNSYGTFEPVTVLTPVITTAKAQLSTTPDVEPFFTEEWICDKKYVFNGYLRRSYGGRLFINIAGAHTLDAVVETPHSRIVVSTAWGCPLIISTRQEDCYQYFSAGGSFEDPCPEPMPFVVNGMKWYWSAVGWGYDGAQCEQNDIYPYTYGEFYWAFVVDSHNWAYPTQDCIASILGKINPQLKEV